MAILDYALSELPARIRRAIATGAIRIGNAGFDGQGLRTYAAATERASLTLYCGNDGNIFKKGIRDAAGAILHELENLLAADPEAAGKFLADVIADKEAVVKAACLPTGTGEYWPDAIDAIVPSPEEIKADAWNRFWPIHEQAFVLSFDGASMNGESIRNWTKAHPGMLLRQHCAYMDQTIFYGWCTPNERTICFRTVPVDLSKPWQIVMEPDNETGRLMEQFRDIPATKCLDAELNLYRYIG